MTSRSGHAEAARQVIRRRRGRGADLGQGEAGKVERVVDADLFVEVPKDRLFAFAALA
jgi:hypothetical protein